MNYNPNTFQPSPPQSRIHLSCTQSTPWVVHKKKNPQRYDLISTLRLAASTTAWHLCPYTYPPSNQSYTTFNLAGFWPNETGATVSTSLQCTWTTAPIWASNLATGLLADSKPFPSVPHNPHTYLIWFPPRRLAISRHFPLKLFQW